MPFNFNAISSKYLLHRKAKKKQILIIPNIMQIIQNIVFILLHHFIRLLLCLYDQKEANDILDQNVLKN